MSIPTIFTNANCQTQIPGELDGGGMLQFCRTFKAGMPGMDVCKIDTQEDYNEYQLGCVNGRHGTFIDNNNNTVKLEFTQNYIPVLEAAIEFPIGSHDNLHTLSPPQQGYVAPYPIFITQDNCRDSRTTFTMCCPARPAWSIEETVPKSGECVLIDDSAVEGFGKCCVSSLHGTYVNPLDGSVTTPDTTNDPATEFPTGDTAGEVSEIPEVTLPVSDSFASNDMYFPVDNRSELQDLDTEDSNAESDDLDSEQSSEKSSAGVVTNIQSATLILTLVSFVAINVV